MSDFFSIGSRSGSEGRRPSRGGFAIKAVLVLVPLAVAPVFSGCGSSTRSSVSTPVAVATREVAVGGTLQLTTTVTGRGSGDVVWTVEQGGGTFSETTPGLYTAGDTAGTVIVKATLRSDSSKSNTTFLTVRPVITVASSVVGTFTDATVNLGATVRGTSDPLTWAVESGANKGSLTNVTRNSAQYVAPTTPGTYAVRVSTADGAVTSTISVIVQARTGGAIVVSPAQVSATAGERVQLNAVIPGATSNAVTWATTGGTISATGEFFADTAGDYTVTATSTENPTLSTFIRIRVAAPVVQTTTLVVQPNPAGSVITGAGLAFSANQSVTWSVSGGGTISASGFYTAPATVPSGNVIVTATPTSGGATPVQVSVTVVAGTPPPQPLQLAVSPSTNVAVTAGQTVGFVANQDVVWSVSGGGSISASGTYTAPLAVPTPDTVTVTATPTNTAVAAISVPVKINPVPLQTFAVAPNPVPDPGVELGKTLQFSASRSVTWSIVESGTGASIAADGTFTAPETLPATSGNVVTVKATATDPNFVPVQVSVKIIDRGTGSGSVTIQ